MLGVRVVEVEPDMIEGRCARWYADERVVRLCRHLCPTGARRALTGLLESAGLAE